MNVIYKQSIKKKRQNQNRKLDALNKRYEGLKYKDTQYARQVRALMKLRSRVAAIYAEAPNEIFSHNDQQTTDKIGGAAGSKEGVLLRSGIFTYAGLPTGRPTLTDTRELNVLKKHKNKLYKKKKQVRIKREH